MTRSNAVVAAISLLIGTAVGALIWGGAYLVACWMIGGGA